MGAADRTGAGLDARGDGRLVSVALAFTEIHEKRVGLGTGMVVALVSTTLEAIRNVRRKARRRKEV